MRKTTYVLLLFAATVFTGCTGAKEAAKAPHPLTGAWDYSLDTPQGTFTGVLTFTEVDDMLSGTIAQSQQPDQAAPLEELAFNGESSEVTFKFDSGEYGLMVVNITLDGDTLNGLMNVTQFGADVPLTATRKTEM